MSHGWTQNDFSTSIASAERAAAITILVCLVAPFNAGLNFYLVWIAPDRPDMFGAPLATAVSIDLLALLALLYCVLFVPRAAWAGFSLSIFSWKIMDNIKLGADVRLSFYHLAPTQPDIDHRELLALRVNGGSLSSAHWPPPC